MKTVILMRHGDAEANGPGGDDEWRPLSLRGHRQAGNIGRQLADLGVSLDLGLVSGATRTSETAADVFSVAGRPAVVECDRCFYVGGPSTWTDRLQTLPNDVATVICVGHNPSMGTLASMIGGRRVAYETATTVIAGLDISEWASLLHPDVTVDATVLRPERS